jgi:phenylalanyl-tRNA synthetase beta chain
VIADAEKPVAVAGVMGGEISGTTNETTTIVFEAATFDPVSVRRTSRKLNLYSDSQLLFEKGLSVQSTQIALARAVELALEIAGGSVASEIFDVKREEYQSLVFSFRPEKARKLLGVDIETQDMKKYLTDLGFELMGDGERYEVTVPYWRDHDIENEVDFSEEIARVYGYHNIPGVLPRSAQPDLQVDDYFSWSRRVKNLLLASGYNEIYGYSFVAKRDLERYDLDPEKALELYNPLSSDLTHMRTSLMPSLLKDIEMNQGNVAKGAVFELANVYYPRENDLPEEYTWLTIAHYGVEDAEKAFLEIKGVLELLGEKSNLKFDFIREEENIKWHATRTAKLQINGEDVGVLGQVADSYQEAFGINRLAVVAELDFEKLVSMMRIALRYQNIPEYPAVLRDISIAVNDALEYAEIEKTVKDQSPLIESV